MTRCTIVLILGLLGTHSAMAQLDDALPEAAGDIRLEKPTSDWVVRLGGFGLVTPKYQGSDQHKIRAFPVIDIEYKEIFFLNPVKGLGAWLWSGSNTRVGASLAYRSGRDEDDSSRLEGLGDIDGGMTTNVYLEWNSRPWSADLHYSRQVTGNDTGSLLDLSAGYGFRLVGPVFVKPSLKLRLADSDYNERYFGVSARQSADSGLPAYDASGGVNSVGAGLFGMMFLSKHWSLQTILNYERLLGDAEDSPVVQSKHQLRGGLGFTYQF